MMSGERLVLGELAQAATLNDVREWMRPLLHSGELHPDDRAAVEDILRGLNYLFEPGQKIVAQKPPYERSGRTGGRDG